MKEEMSGRETRSERGRRIGGEPGSGRGFGEGVVEGGRDRLRS